MLGFFKDIAAAVRARGMKELLEFVPGGKYLYDIGADALKRRKERHAQQKLEDEVKEMVAAKIDAALLAKEAVEAEAADLPPREKELLAQFVAAIPDAARNSLARKDDPSGRSVPAGFTLQFGEDVAKLLPQSPPRFVPGDSVPGLGSWVLVKKLGGGGFGEVWLAEHAWKKTEPPAAFKFCTDAASRTRLATHEKDLIVRVMRHGEHPNIVPLLECSLDGPTPWLKYEYVAGGTLADEVRQWRDLAAAERVGKAVGVLHTLAGAVGHFHAMTPPIVHRDLKPANVLMDGEVPRITDFGIGGAAVAAMVDEERTRGASARTPLPSVLSGSYSLHYSSPQQRNGDAPDPRDDVHALGVIAYQMLTGDLSAVPGRDMDDDLRDAGAPDDLIALIGKSVSQKADRRPADARVWEATLTPKSPAPPARTAATSPPRLAPPASREGSWHIPVAGVWYARPAGSRSAPWAKVTQTPAHVDTQTGEEYKFEGANSFFQQEDQLAGLLGLSGQVALTELRLHSSATDAGLSRLREFSGLNTLSISFCDNLTDAGFLPIRELPALGTLHLVGCKQLTDQGLSHLSQLPSLTDLSLWQCERITGVGLRHVPGLTSLDVRNTNVTDAGLAHVRGMTALRVLNLGDCRGPTDAGLSHLVRHPALEELILAGCKWVTDAGVGCLRHLSALKDLRLGGCVNITDAGLGELTNLRALNTLYLRACTGVTGTGLSHLRVLPALSTLDLYATRTADADVARLGHFPALRDLNLGCTGVTDAGLSHLRSIPNLSRLDLWGCKGVTEAGVADLQRWLPECHINR